MNKFITSLLVLSLLLQFCSGRIVFGLLDSENTLIKFDSSAPGNLISSIPITGLGDGARAVGIDFRPFNGRLYVVTTLNQIFYVNTITGAATLTSTLNNNCVIDGTLRYSVDFNPVADRLRIISSTGVNYRVNVDVLAGDCTIDGAISGVSILQATYTGNFRGSSNTQLFTIAADGTGTANLGLVSTPNSGTFQNQGSLNIAIAAPAGFDSVPASLGQSAFTWAALNVAGVTGLYNIDTSGVLAGIVGTIGNGAALRSIAITLAAVSKTMYALDTGNNVLRFESEDPSSVVSRTVTGLNSGELLLGFDFRPKGGNLYAVTSTARLMTINLLTYAATQVGAAALSCPMTGNLFGVDFNPNVDRLRVISDANINYAINVDTNECTVQSSINVASGAAPTLTAVAYTNNVDGASSTVSYAIDTTGKTVGAITPPAAGTYTNPVPLTVAAPNGLNAALDIFFQNSAEISVASVEIDGASYLVLVDTATGALTFVSQIGTTLVKSLSAAFWRVPYIGNGFYPQVLALTNETPQRVISVNSADTLVVSASAAVTGLDAGTTLYGMDFRPSNNRIYGVSSNNKIWIIDSASAIAYPGNAITGCSFTAGRVYTLNFNPVADLLRVVSDSAENYRIDVDSGACTVDTSLNYTSLGNPANPVSAVGVAYSNSVTPRPGATAEYVVDSVNEQWSQVTNPNGGITQQIANVGLDVPTGRASPIDIFTNGGANNGFIVINNRLYDVNLGSGILRPYGEIVVASANVIGLTALPQNYVPPPVPTPTTSTTSTSTSTSTGSTNPTNAPTSGPTNGPTNGGTTGANSDASSVVLSFFAVACTIALLI